MAPSSVAEAMEDRAVPLRGQRLLVRRVFVSPLAPTMKQLPLYLTALMFAGCATVETPSPQQLRVSSVNRVASVEIDFTQHALWASLGFKNVKQCKDGIQLNGLYEHGNPSGYRAHITDPSINYTDYTIAIIVKPFDTDGKHQTILCGGPSYRWFSLKSDAMGNLSVTLNNQDVTLAVPNDQISPRKWTSIVASVSGTKGNIIISVDGKKSEILRIPRSYKPKIIGSDAEPTDKSWTFTNYSDGTVFHGIIHQLVVYNAALNENECESLALAR
jgi:hypothetical protein